MRNNTAVEQINTLSFQPETGRWVAMTESTYVSKRRAKRKIAVSALLIGAFFYCYNPMVNYQQKAIQTDSVAIATSTVNEPVLIAER